MDVKVNAGSLVSAIADPEIHVAVDEIVDEFRKQAFSLVQSFAADQPTPEQAHGLENRLHQKLLETGRRLIEWLFSHLEPAIDRMPGTVSFRDQSHRRLPDKTLRSDIVTRFGKISLERARYRRGRAGKVIFPMEILLGIENGFTPAAADRIGKQFAACGSSQGRTLEMITDHTEAKIGTSPRPDTVHVWGTGRARTQEHTVPRETEIR